MPSTFTHGLVPAGCLAFTKKRYQPIPKSQLFRLAAIAFILGNTPDLDVIPASMLSQYFPDIHRHWGHNLFCITLYIFAGTWLFKRFVDEAYRPKRLWLTSALLVLSHVLFDSMGDIGVDGIRKGVPLLWPLSDWEFLMPLELFKSYVVDENLPMLWAHIICREFWTRAVFTEVAFTVLFIPTWVLGYAMSRRFKNRTASLTEEANTEKEVKAAS